MSVEIMMEITNRISDGNHLTRESVERRKNWMKITNRISCGNHLTRVSVKVTIHCNCSFLKQLLYQLLHLQISFIVYHGGYDDDDTMMMTMLMMTWNMMLILSLMQTWKTDKTWCKPERLWMIMGLVSPERLEEMPLWSHSCIDGSSLGPQGCTFNILKLLIFNILSFKYWSFSFRFVFNCSSLDSQSCTFWNCHFLFLLFIF